MKRTVVAFIARRVFAGSYQYRFLLFLKAVWAYGVKRLIRLAFFFEQVHKDSRFGFVKLISGGLTAPLFACFDLAFQRLIDFGNILIISLHGKHLGLQIDDVVGQCCDVIFPVGVRGANSQGLNKSSDRANACSESGYFRNHLSANPLANNDEGQPVCAVD